MEHLPSATHSSVLGFWEKAMTEQVREGPYNCDAFVLYEGDSEPVCFIWPKNYKTVKQSDVRVHDWLVRAFGEATFLLRSYRHPGAWHGNILGAGHSGQEKQSVQRSQGWDQFNHTCGNQITKSPALSSKSTAASVDIWACQLLASSLTCEYTTS